MEYSENTLYLLIIHSSYTGEIPVVYQYDMEVPCIIFRSLPGSDELEENQHLTHTKKNNKKT